MSYQIIENKIIEDKNENIFWTINFDIQKYYLNLIPTYLSQSSLAGLTTYLPQQNSISCSYLNSYHPFFRI